MNEFGSEDKFLCLAFDSFEQNVLKVKKKLINHQVKLHEKHAKS